MRGGVRRYRMPAGILLAELSATGDEPAAAAFAAGRTSGAHQVPRPAPFDEVTRDEALDRLTAMLDALDFAPEPVAPEPVGLNPAGQHPPDRIRLRHRPSSNSPNPTATSSAPCTWA